MPSPKRIYVRFEMVLDELDSAESAVEALLERVQDVDPSEGPFAAVVRESTSAEEAKIVVRSVDPDTELDLDEEDLASAAAQTPQTKTFH